MPEAGESALILLYIILPTSLNSVFGVSLCGGRKYYGCFIYPNKDATFRSSGGFFPDSCNIATP
jgi:hypothetical protein